MWNKVGDKLPAEKTSVLIRDGKNDITTVACLVEGRWYIAFPYLLGNDYITHWTELPENPEE